MDPLHGNILNIVICLLIRRSENDDKTIFVENSLPDGGSKGEKAERLPLDSEHRLCRAQDINQEAIPAVLSGNWTKCFFYTPGLPNFVRITQSLC